MLNMRVVSCTAIRTSLWVGRTLGGQFAGLPCGCFTRLHRWRNYIQWL